MPKLDFYSLPDEVQEALLNHLFDAGEGDRDAIKVLNRVGISFYESVIEWMNNPENKEYFYFKQIFTYQGKFWCLCSTFHWNLIYKDSLDTDWDSIFQVTSTTVAETKWVFA